MRRRDVLALLAGAGAWAACSPPLRALAQGPQAPEPSLNLIIGQMLMAGFRGFSVGPRSPIIRDITLRHLGGVILFNRDAALASDERNIENTTQLRELTRTLAGCSPTPLFIACDQEGGRVQRLRAERGFTETPSAAELAGQGLGEVRQAGSTVGRQLADHGINLDFAPVADVNVDPQSPAIGALGRSFSADPDTVAECCAAFIEGLHEHRVLSCLKHFPGHGSAGADSHLGLTDVSATWSENELVPYRSLFKRGLADMVMTAHIFNDRLDPEHPATLSHAVLTGLLREQLGFTGVIVTDDMNMGAITERYGFEQAVRLAVLAGADILLYGNNLVYDPDAVARAHGVIRAMADSGEVPVARLRASYDRIMRLKARLAM